MLEVLTGLFDSTGFTRRASCGTDWTSSLIWLHATSDLFIWLAYVSIPLVLLYFTRRRDLPFPRLFVLFALFILACGTTHFLDALMFEYPVYRFAGVMKAVTAIVSWATVIALIQVVPRVMTVMAEAEKPGADTKLHRTLPTGAGRRTPPRAYIVAILAGVLAILVRAAINPLLKDDNIFVVALLAVVYVGWQHGFRPALVTLVISVAGYSYFFMQPRNTFFVEGLGSQLAVALFFFCGVACAALGESQRGAQRRAKAALSSALARQEELESEVTRRRVVEAALRQREGELTTARNQTGEALARLDAFLDNAPVGIVFFDQNLRYERINTFLATANGKPVSEHIGRTLSEVLPDFPPQLAETYRKIATGELAAYSDTVQRPDHRTGGRRDWQATAFPVRREDGRTIGAGVVLHDMTERLKAEQELRRSERNLADFFENANVGLHWVDARGIIVRANKAELEMLGYERDEYIGHAIEDFHESRETICDILDRLQRGEYLNNYPARLRRKDGGTRDVLISSSALFDDGKFVHSRCFTRDITEQKHAADELAEQARVAALRAEIAAALAAANETSVALRACADTLFHSVGAALARIWTTDPSGEWLELRASSGLYTHTNGPHGRVRVGEFKIGRIAQTGTPHLTNDLANDPHVSDPAWAAREGLRAFVGYPLMVEGHVLGVMAVFARHPLSEAVVGDLGLIAANIAQFVLRRRVEADIRRSEERYRTLTEAVPNVVWNADGAGEVTYFNQRWLEYTAVPLASARGRWWLNAVHPDDRDRVHDAWRATVERVAAGDSDRFSEEFRLLNKATGEYRWFQSVAVPLRHANGTVDQWIGSMADIHDQKAAVEAVRASDAFRRSMFENSPDCLKVFDLDGRVLEMNQAGCQLMELDDFADLRGRSWPEQWPVANRETIREALAGAREGRVGRFQGFCPTAKGTPRYWDVSIAPLPGADGTPFRLLGVSRDVTEQRRIEDVVRASEQRFRTLTEAVPQIVWTANPRGDVTFFNRRWNEYTGVKLESGRENGWGAELLHPDDADQLRAGWQLAVLQQADGFSQEFRLRRASDGEYRWFLSTAVPLRDAVGAIDEWVGTLTDIDDQKRQTVLLERMVRERTAALEQVNGALVGEIEIRQEAEEKVRAVAVELGRSNSELEKFAYIASHDLQEPLRKIQAFGDRLVTKFREVLPDKGKDYVDRMLTAAGRMRRLIDDLLTFSRVTTQRHPFVRLDLNKLVPEVVSDLEVRIGQANGTVVVGGLPRIDADRTQMRQLFQNLIANAVKFQRQGVPPVVEISGELANPSPADPGAENAPVCRISVRDNGIGFDEKYRDRIFEVFQRLHGRDEYEGTGVGLAICRKIVERHGGTITAHSREGEGATFVVTLPARHSNSREGSDDDAEPEQTDHHTDGR